MLTEADTCRKFVVPSLQNRLGQHLSDPAAADRFLTLFNLTTGKIPHYYQRITIDRVIQAILGGRCRVLVTMATGTGKTVVAFQICWKLWSSKWNKNSTPHPGPLPGRGGEGVSRKPRILYLADRNFLVDDPKDKTYYAPEAREILSDLLEKYAADGEVQFTLPDVLKVPPISQRGNVAEIARHFGSFEQLGKAVKELQTLLYAQ